MKESTKELLQDVIQFLENNHTGTKEHTDIISRVHSHYESEKDYFEITCVHRDDLVNFDTTNIDDSTMVTLADKLSDDYCDQLYWQSLNLIADGLDIPRLGDKTDEEDESN